MLVGETETLPLVAFPVENPPAATQVVASVEDHVSVDEAPETIVAGEAFKVAVGGVGGGDDMSSEHEAVEFVPTQSQV